MTKRKGEKPLGSDDYKPLKPEGMSLAQKVLLGIAAAGVIGFGGYKVFEHYYEKHQNRAEVKAVDLRSLGLNLKYTKYEKGEPAIRFDWWNHSACCDKITIEQLTKNYWAVECYINDKPVLSYNKGISLEFNNFKLRDYDCDGKCDEVHDGNLNTTLCRKEEGFPKETADKRLLEAKSMLEKEIDFEKTVNDWLKKHQVD